MKILNVSSPPTTRPFTNESEPLNTSQKSEPKAQNNEKIYQDVYSKISERYADFDLDTEFGFQGKPGITGDIESISKRDLIAVLEHIKSDTNLLERCKKDSVKTPFFTKFYLMSNSEQGWNLRLHSFNVRGNGLGGEDAPHHHRWVLASQVLTGGYINVNYQEDSKTNSTPEKYIYSKYEVGPSNTGDNNGARKAIPLGEVALSPIKKTLYAQGSLNHFPLALAHSVETHSDVMGTTLTLAHTSKAAKDTAIAFEKTDSLESLPAMKIHDNATFTSMLQDQITHLQILVLSDNLNTLLTTKFEYNGDLTAGEEKHLSDYKEPNYVETSLLPSLAIYQMEVLNGVEHVEFSRDTAQIIDRKLLEMDQQALDNLISSNQLDLLDRKLTIEVNDTLLAEQLKKRPTKIMEIS